jgi:hypothetical protein
MDLIRFTYFVDKVLPDPEDRFWKVRPLFEHTNKMAKKYVKHPENVSVDEGMIKYFGPHPLKQFIRGKPIRFGYKVWMLATPTGELLAVQPYAGGATHIQDFGLGQGPNVVMGLALQYGLQPGAKVYVDNLFTSLDLLDHMGDKRYGVTGTLRQNRIIGIPLPSKKQANKELKRGEMKAVYTQDAVVTVWQDNQPVYMASNCDSVEPLAQCLRYSRKDKAYKPFPQPNMNKLYNKNMGGVDLLDNSTKNYAITTRVRKWYWCLYTWFLNVNMVQAWRLYRAHKKEQHRLVQVQEQEEQEELERQLLQDHAFKPAMDSERKDHDRERKRRRTNERKVEEISLLDFTRQVVEMMVKKHSDTYDMPIPQREVVPSVSSAVREEVRVDQGNHLIKLTQLRGVCKLCKKRSQFRCNRCDVALHPECFFSYHVPEVEM